jgi:hypothetical protein
MANLDGIDNIADILITFDVQCHFSSKLYMNELTSMPTSVRRLILLSALKYQPKAITDLRGHAALVNIDFNMASIGLHRKESNRKVKNLIIFLTGDKSLDKFKATFNSTNPPDNKSIEFEKAVAMSNIPPAEDMFPLSTPSPLNAFANADANQNFKLTIDKTKNPGVDFSKVTDVVFGIEYQTDLVR